MKKSVLITGSGGGIGAALVAAFHDAGWRVIGTDIKPQQEDVDAYHQADLGAFAQDPKRLSEFAAAIRDKCADAPLAALINNAAVQHLGELDKLAHARIVETMNVNVIAPMLLAKAFLSDLEKAGGVIINIGSVHAEATKPEFAAYATSKAALHGLTRALAVDFCAKARVVTLAPAATATPMLKAGFEGQKDAFKALEAAHPAGRIASPEEIAKIALFLASEDASFITGATVYADGGVLARLHDPV